MNPNQVLFHKGFLVRNDVLAYIVNDDPEDFHLSAVADVTGVALGDIIDYMGLAGWPQSEGWDCPSCKQSLVYEIGEYCRYCMDAHDQAERAGV